NAQIAEQVEICLMDEQRLTALQTLPRVNSMALSLASIFPALIGSRLHLTLAQLPCRPMQCQSMVALLQDVYVLAEWLALSKKEVVQIGQCRYLIEVSELYQGWLKRGLGSEPCFSNQVLMDLSDTPKEINLRPAWYALSEAQQHAWWLDYGIERVYLVAWKDSDGLWVALIECPKSFKEKALASKVIRVRGEKNILPTAKQLTALHLWIAG
ncbi:MAG: hypothetical protein L3J00_07915, partial [Thiomicrorhabdus sp.]|nr:hypothetical protein [Thiomicrorhabdus sp.]